MNISQLAANGTKLDLLLAEVKGDIKLTQLPPAKPKKAHLTANRVGGGGTRWQPSARAGSASRHIKAGATA